MSRITVGSLVGPYTITSVLPQGQGGMARVYSARGESRSGVTYDVALKVMRADVADSQEEEFFSAALHNEVEILRRLRHPNVVRIYPIPLGGQRATPFIARDHDLPGEPWYFVMEYLGGGSLGGMLKRRKRLPVEEAVQIAGQIATALDYVRAKGIAHRDVKPDNILFRAGAGAEGHVEPVLVDFGIAAKLRRIGLPAGSIRYMSPERLQVVRGELDPDQVADEAEGDVYALGGMVYQMLTGHPLFEEYEGDRLANAILERAPTLLQRYNPEIPPPLEEVVMRMLRKDPSRRPTAEEMVAWMEQTVPPPWAAPAVTPQSPQRRASSLLPWVLCAASTAALIGVLAYNTFQGPAAPTPTPPIAATAVSTAVEAPKATQALVASPTPRPSPTPIPTAPPVTPSPATPTPIPVTNTQ
jgi:serine/threonine protein kinase